MTKVPRTLPLQKIMTDSVPLAVMLKAGESVAASDIYYSKVKGEASEAVTLKNALREPTKETLTPELVHSITLVEVAFEEGATSVAILEKLCGAIDPQVLAQRVFADAKDPERLSKTIQGLEAKASQAPKLLATLLALRGEFEQALAVAAPLALEPAESITVASADAHLRTYRLARAAASLSKNAELRKALDSAHLRYLRAYDSQVLRESTSHMRQAAAAKSTDPARARHHVDQALKQQAYFADMARAAHRSEEAATWELRRTEGQRLRCQLDAKVALPADIPGLDAARQDLANAEPTANAQHLLGQVERTSADICSDWLTHHETKSAGLDEPQRKRMGSVRSERLVHDGRAYDAFTRALTAIDAELVADDSELLRQKKEQIAVDWCAQASRVLPAHTHIAAATVAQSAESTGALPEDVAAFRREGVLLERAAAEAALLAAQGRTFSTDAKARAIEAAEEQLRLLDAKLELASKVEAGTASLTEAQAWRIAAARSQLKLAELDEEGANDVLFAAENDFRRVRVAKKRVSQAAQQLRDAEAAPCSNNTAGEDARLAHQSVVDAFASGGDWTDTALVTQISQRKQSLARWALGADVPRVIDATNAVEHLIDAHWTSLERASVRAERRLTERVASRDAKRLALKDHASAIESSLATDAAVDAALTQNSDVGRGYRLLTGEDVGVADWACDGDVGRAQLRATQEQLSQLDLHDDQDRSAQRRLQQGRQNLRELREQNLRELQSNVQSFEASLATRHDDERRITAVRLRGREAEVEASLGRLTSAHASLSKGSEHLSGITLTEERLVEAKRLEARAYESFERGLVAVGHGGSAEQQSVDALVNLGNQADTLHVSAETAFGQWPRDTPKSETMVQALALAQAARRERDERRALTPKLFEVLSESTQRRAEAASERVTDEEDLSILIQNENLPGLSRLATHFSLDRLSEAVAEDRSAAGGAMIDNASRTLALAYADLAEGYGSVLRKQGAVAADAYIAVMLASLQAESTSSRSSAATELLTLTGKSASGPLVSKWRADAAVLQGEEAQRRAEQSSLDRWSWSHTAKVGALYAWPSLSVLLGPPRDDARAGGVALGVERAPRLLSALQQVRDDGFFSSGESRSAEDLRELVEAASLTEAAIAKMAHGSDVHSFAMSWHQKNHKRLILAQEALILLASVGLPLAAPTSVGGQMLEAATLATRVTTYATRTFHLSASASRAFLSASRVIIGAGHMYGMQKAQELASELLTPLLGPDASAGITAVLGMINVGRSVKLASGVPLQDGVRAFAQAALLPGLMFGVRHGVLARMRDPLRRHAAEKALSYAEPFLFSLHGEWNHLRQSVRQQATHKEIAVELVGEGPHARELQRLLGDLQFLSASPSSARDVAAAVDAFKRSASKSETPIDAAVVESLCQAHLAQWATRTAVETLGAPRSRLAVEAVVEKARALLETLPITNKSDDLRLVLDAQLLSLAALVSPPLTRAHLTDGSQIVPIVATEPPVPVARFVGEPGDFSHRVYGQIVGRISQDASGNTLADPVLVIARAESDSPVFVTESESQWHEVVNGTSAAELNAFGTARFDKLRAALGEDDRQALDALLARLPNDASRLVARQQFSARGRLSDAQALIVSLETKLGPSLPTNAVLRLATADGRMQTLGDGRCAPTAIDYMLARLFPLNALASEVTEGSARNDELGAVLEPLYEQASANGLTTDDIALALSKVISLATGESVAFEALTPANDASTAELEAGLALAASDVNVPPEGILVGVGKEGADAHAIVVLGSRIRSGADGTPVRDYLVRDPEGGTAFIIPASEILPRLQVVFARRGSPRTTSIAAAPVRLRGALPAKRKASGDDHTRQSWWQRLWSKRPPTTPDGAPTKGHPYRHAASVERAASGLKSIADLEQAVREAQAAVDAASEANPNTGPNALVAGHLVGVALALGGAFTGVRTELTLAAVASIIAGHLVSVVKSRAGDKLDDAIGALTHARKELRAAETREKALPGPQAPVKDAKVRVEETEPQTRAILESVTESAEDSPESTPRQMRLRGTTDDDASRVEGSALRALATPLTPLQQSIRDVRPLPVAEEATFTRVAGRMEARLQNAQLTPEPGAWPAQPLKIALDLDDTLISGVVSEISLPHDRTFNLIGKNGETYSSSLLPGTLELLSYLSSLPNVELSIVSSGTAEHVNGAIDAITLPDGTPLRSKLHKIITREDLPPNRVKDVPTLMGAPPGHALLVDDNSLSAVAPEHKSILVWQLGARDGVKGSVMGQDRPLRGRGLTMARRDALANYALIGLFDQVLKAAKERGVSPGTAYNALFAHERYSGLPGDEQDLSDLAALGAAGRRVAE